MDVELVDVYGVRRIHAFPDGEPDLIALPDDDLLAAAGPVVLVVVVADRCLARRAQGRSDLCRSHHEHREGELPSHAPYTISEAKNPAANNATIPNVASATSPTARPPFMSEGWLRRRQR